MTSPLSLRKAARLAVAGLLLFPVDGSAQLPDACPGGRISRIEIRSQDPYDEKATAEEAALDWAFRALNWLHLETRERVIRWELLFSEGSCYDPLRLSETERRLRGLPFLQSASVTSERLSGGTHRIVVETRDSWAISASLGVDLEDGLDLTGLQAAYGNVLGYGLRTQLFRRVFRERLRYGVLVRHLNLFGTGVDAVAHGGDTRSGTYVSQSLHKPFQSEFDQNALRQLYTRRDDFFSYALPPASDFTPAYLRYRAELAELSYQRRLGPETGRQAVVGVGVSAESFSAPFGPSGARAVVDGDFDGSVEAPDSVLVVIEGQSAPYSAKRLSVFLGMRDASFETRRGVDAITAVQDLMVGDELMLTVGRGLAFATDDHDDALIRLQGRMGLIGPRHYLMARLDAQARRALDGPAGPRGWRDLVMTARTDAYWSQTGRSSLYLRARYAAGWRTDRPFQLRLGGRDGVRAYSEDAFPGSRMLFASLEQRVSLDEASPGFADLGAAIFVDAGRMWAGDVPFGGDSGWETGIGAGLRAAPAGSRRVLRMDLTLPLGHQREARGVVFRIYSEIFGVLDRRRWPSQVERSRWYGTDPDLSRRVPDPLAGN